MDNKCLLIEWKLVVMYGYETWSLTVRQEHRLRVFEKKMLRRIFIPERDEVVGGRRNCIMGSFITCTLYNHNDQVKEY
jgi:hypothetical protein